MFMDQVCVLSNHEYLVIWVDLNPICFVNMLEIINLNMTCLPDTFNSFN